MRTVKSELGLSDLAKIGTTSSSPYLGSPEFDEVPFQVDAGHRPLLGNYVIIDRADGSVAHYGRIISGTEDNPRADPGKLQRGKAFQVGEKDPRPGEGAPHVTRVMMIQVLGELRLDGDGNLNLEEPSLLPETGKDVYEIPAAKVPWLLGIPDSPDQGLHLGYIKSGGDEVDFYLPLEALARHTALMGKTGVGKSYAGGVIMEELVRLGIPIISFDVLEDVVNAADELGGRNFRAGKDFRVPYSVIGLSEFLNFIPNLTNPQTELVALAYDKISTEALGSLHQEGEVAVSLSRLLDEIQSIGDSFGQEAVASRAKTRVQAAVSRNSLLTTKTEDWLEDLGSKSIINVFVGHLGQNFRNLVVGATARMLQALRRRNQVPPFVFLLDEAHLFLPSGGEVTPSTYVLREMIRTARHDMIGIILLTQSPGSMDRQVLLTCNTRFVFALDRDDLRVVGGTMGDLPEETLGRIPKMAKGSTVVSSGMDIMRHPATVRIRQRRTPEGAPTPNLAEEVKKWRTSH